MLLELIAFFSSAADTLGQGNLTAQAMKEKTVISSDVLTVSCSSTAGSGSVEWTPEEEKDLVRKFDRRILPGLSALYLLCFLDRTYDSIQFYLILEILAMPGSFVREIQLIRPDSRGWNRTWE